MGVVLRPLGWALAFLGELGDVMGERRSVVAWRRELGNLRGKPPAAVTAAEGTGPGPLDCCCSRPEGSPWASVAGSYYHILFGNLW